jgi:hypothetical protein
MGVDILTARASVGCPGAVDSARSVLPGREPIPEPRVPSPHARLGSLLALQRAPAGTTPSPTFQRVHTDVIRDFPRHDGARHPS